LYAGVLLSSSAVNVVGAAIATAATPNVDGAAAAAAPNVAVKAAATVTQNVYGAAVPRLPSGKMQQRQEQDCDMTVTNLSYKQQLATDHARARIASKIGHKVTVKQGNGRQKKQI
jgi:hypothetical protein